jgi:phosphohistidine phosphatase
MTRILTLLRHAKSSRDDIRLSDIDRPLAERGCTDAPRMAAWMKANAITPDLVLCSTSVRTRQTLSLMSAALPRRVETRFDANLYHADAALLLRSIQALGSPSQHALVIGHNPGFHDLALRLIGAGDKNQRAALGEKFSTCGCAVLTFSATSWTDVTPKAGTLAHWMSPRWLGYVRN